MGVIECEEAAKSLGFDVGIDNKVIFVGKHETVNLPYGCTVIDRTSEVFWNRLSSDIACGQITIEWADANVTEQVNCICVDIPGTRILCIIEAMIIDYI